MYQQIRSFAISKETTKMRLGGIKMFPVAILKSIFLLFLFSFLPSNITAQTVFVNSFCSETAGNFTSGSLYQTNLATVLTNLTAQASSTIFHNTSSGTGADTVFGLYYCRFPFESQCQDCIQTAAQKLLEVCPTDKEATAYYMGCTLRYADHSIVSVEEETPVADFHTPETVPDPEEFRPVLNETMDKAIKMAAFGTDPSLLGIGLGTATLLSGANLSSVAQCSLHITGVSCNKCLRAAFAVVPVCCDESLTTWIFLPSCDLVYTVALPNDTSSTAASPPLLSSSPPPPVTSETISPPPPPTELAGTLGGSDGWILNCGGSVRLGFLVALIMIVL